MPGADPNRGTPPCRLIGAKRRAGNSFSFPDHLGSRLGSLPLPKAENEIGVHLGHWAHADPRRMLDAYSETDVEHAPWGGKSNLTTSRRHIPIDIRRLLHGDRGRLAWGGKHHQDITGKR